MENIMNIDIPIQIILENQRRLDILLHDLAPEVDVRAPAAPLPRLEFCAFFDRLGFVVDKFSEDLCLLVPGQKSEKMGGRVGKRKGMERDLRQVGR
jgi:hypothetical protein